MAAQDRRLQAIGSLWNEVLDLRERYGRAQMIWNVYTAEEITKTTDFGADFLAGIPPTFDAFMVAYPVDIPKSEEHRPFVGERFWLLFYIYRAVCSRLALRVSEGIERGKIPPWDRDLAGNDDGVIQLLGHVLSDEELAYVRGQVIGGPRLALQLLENKMLADAEVKLSGSHAVETWMAEGRRALDMLKGLNEATQAAPTEA